MDCRLIGTNSFSANFQTPRGLADGEIASLVANSDEAVRQIYEQIGTAERELEILRAFRNLLVTQRSRRTRSRV
jgi:hypothetical protein